MFVFSYEGHILFYNNVVIGIMFLRETRTNFRPTCPISRTMGKTYASRVKTRFFNSSVQRTTLSEHPSTQSNTSSDIIHI